MTPRQRDVLDYFERYYREHGIPPTLTDAARELGMKSKSTAHGHAQSLVAQGRLEPQYMRGTTIYFPTSATRIG